MSKLYETYKRKKEKEPEKIYLFKSGMFYIFLEDDAKKVSDLFGFKITKLNEQVIKCGFPLSRIDYYTELLQKRQISFEIVDNNYLGIENYEDYMNNEKLKRIVKDVKKIDMDNITFREAYEFLAKIKTEIGEIYK